MKSINMEWIKSKLETEDVIFGQTNHISKIQPHSNEIDVVVRRLDVWTSLRNIQPIYDSYSKFYNVIYKDQFYAFGITLESNETWVCKNDDDISLGNYLTYENLTEEFHGDFIHQLSKTKQHQKRK